MTQQITVKTTLPVLRSRGGRVFAESTNAWDYAWNCYRVKCFYDGVKQIASAPEHVANIIVSAMQETAETLLTNVH